MTRLLVKLPETSHVGALHMRLNLSGFRRLLFLPLLFLLLLFLLVLPFLLPQSGAEALGELGNEVFVEGGEGEQVRSKKSTPGCGFSSSGGGRGADTTGGERER